MRKEKEYLSKLIEYIELANKIPPDFIFPTTGGIFELTLKRVPNDSGSCNFKDLIETFKIFTKDFPKDLHDYVFSEDESDEDSLKAVERKMDLLSSLNHGLGTLAYAVTEEYFGEKVPVNETILIIEDVLPQYSPILTVSISVNEKGFIEAKTGEFFDFITTYKIEARRIRNCVICNKIFWANRLDKWTCNKACGNKLRQKLWQSANKDEYNEKRRTNYAYKKAMKKQKEIKKNGTL